MRLRRIPGFPPLLVVSLVTLCAATALARTTPEIESPVVDHTNALPAPFERTLGQRLRSHYGKTGVQMAVLVVDTTGGEPIEDYSLRVAQQWRGGRVGQDRGVLLTLALHDRRSRLEVGYGLEPAIPDAAAARILADVRPHLRRARYADGVELAVDRVIGLTDHMEPGEAASASRGLWWLNKQRGFLTAFFIGLLLTGIPVILRRRRVTPFVGTRGKILIGGITLAAAAVVLWLATGIAALGYVWVVAWGGLVAWTFSAKMKTIWLTAILYCCGLFIMAAALPASSFFFRVTPVAALITIGVHGTLAFFGWIALTLITRPIVVEGTSYSSGGLTPQRIAGDHAGNSGGYSGRSGGYSGGSGGSSSGSGGYSGGGGSFGGGGASGGW